MYLSLEKEYYEVVKTVFGVWKKRVMVVGHIPILIVKGKESEGTLEKK